MFYNYIVGSQISLLQILHSSFGLVGIFFLMIKWCCESMWSSFHFCSVSFVWIISPSFCCHNSPCRTDSQLAVEPAWHHQQLLGQSPETLGYTQNLTEREKSHNFSLRAKFSSNCGICLQISSSEGSRLEQFTLLLHCIDHNLHSFAKGIKGIIPTPLRAWQPCKPPQPNSPETRIQSLCSGEQKFICYSNTSEFKHPYMSAQSQIQVHCSSCTGSHKFLSQYGDFVFPSQPSRRNHGLPNI